MQSSASVLLKNLKNTAIGCVKFAGATSQAFATQKKIADRRWTHGPQTIKDQAEFIDPLYHKRAFCQDLNMWVDKDLAAEVTQKDLAQLHQYKMDYWRACHFGATIPVLGGYAVVPLMWMLSHDCWTPSQFNQTADETKEYRKAIDANRYKHAPRTVHETRWWLEMCTLIPEHGSDAWETLFEKNDVRRDPKKCAQVGPMYDQFLKWNMFRRQQGRSLAHAMGIPTFPTWAKMCIQHRMMTYWDIAFNEDYQVITKGLVATMNDEELFDYAWRRYLTPVDKNFTREEVEQKVNDYLAFINNDDKLVQEGKVPNLWVVNAYTLGNYVDPAYLEHDIAELDANDYDHIKDIPRDAFLKRMEFENGPLRDQVEAHSQKILEERKAKAAALASE